MILEYRQRASRNFAPDSSQITLKLDVGHGFEQRGATPAVSMTRLALRVRNTDIRG